MKNIIYVTYAFLFCLGCTSKPKKVVDDQGLAVVESEDLEMNKAIQDSRDTFDKFLQALKSGDSSNYNFAIKYPFSRDDTDEGNEHIWLNSIIETDKKIFGIVNNKPEYTSKIKEGDTVEIDRKKISDWNYTHQGKLVGGYSIKLLRNRMSPEERQEFDRTTGLQFEE